MDSASRHGDAGPLPEISVIIPFDDPRGDASHVKSWTREQSCAAERFEVVVITSGKSTELDAQLRQYLRPHDKLIHTTATNRFGFYDPGAQASAAPLLLLTEDHCVADSRCIEKTLEFMREHPSLDGGFLAAGHINRTTFAEVEQQIYEQMFARHWSREEHWDKVRIRGSVLTKAAYFAAGGLRNDYNHFAETLLSARLYTEGHRLGYVPDALVHHVNTFNFAMMQHEILHFAAGECRYRETDPPELLEPFIGVPPVWSDRHLRSGEVAARAAQAISQLIRRHKQRLDRAGLAALRREWRKSKCDSCTWLRWREHKARLKIMLEKLRFAFVRRARTKRVESMLRFWTNVNELGRMQYCAQHAKPPRALRLLEGDTHLVGESSSAAMIGFHASETWQGRRFRWSGTVAALLLEMAPAAGKLCIDTAALRGPSCDFPFVLLWNGQEVAAADILIRDGRIHFAVTQASFNASGVQQLMIVTAPPPRNANGPIDPRTLGMPIHSISFTPREAMPHTDGRKQLAGPHWATVGSQAHAAH